MDTINVVDDDFVVYAAYSTLDYYIVNKNFEVDTLEYHFKKNHIDEKQIDTIIRIRINKKDTLDYYLSQKSILTSAKIYSTKVKFKEGVSIGLSFDDIKFRCKSLGNVNFTDNILMSDFEGFGKLNLSFNDSLLSSIKIEYDYLD